MTPQAMERLYIFNPDNDLALASGLDYYTAPPMATRLSRDLQLLPAWWAKKGSFLLSQMSTTDISWKDYLSETFGIKINLIGKNHLQNHTFHYQPWGWNASLRNQLLKCCVHKNQLPTPEQIANWRNLSHRRITIDIHQRLSNLLGKQLCPIPTELHSFSEAESFSETHHHCFLKAPWSSSGKGIFRPTDDDNLTFSYWANGILQRQGSIIAEQALRKTLDFAMEFFCDKGDVKFLGYSIFYNNQHNAFDYGIVANEEVLQGIICDELGENGSEQLHEVRSSLTEVLSDLVAPVYNGYVGIDMLVFTDEFGNKAINPCVEMNLRCTMGVVTSIVGNRFIHPQSIGQYHVEYHKAPFDVSAYINQKTAENPPKFQMEDGIRKIKSGVILMTPVYPDSRYCAYIDVRSI